jgi:hypothetical protein
MRCRPPLLWPRRLLAPRSRRSPRLLTAARKGKERQRKERQRQRKVSEAREAQQWGDGDDGGARREVCALSRCLRLRNVVSRIAAAHGR